MQKVWDCFSYFCEKELLILRIKHMYQYVDHFVITESTLTHQAKPKSLQLPAILESELAWARDKIIPLFLDCDPNNLPETTYNKTDKAEFGETIDSIGWRLENLQRNWAMQALEQAAEDDIIIIGDLDEFLNHRALVLLKEITDNREMFALGLLNFLYYLDVQLLVDGQLSWWPGPVIGKRKHLTKPQIWRESRQIIHWDRNLGYHFTWLNKYLPEKFVATAHSELSDLFTIDDMLQRVSSLQDPFSRPNHHLEVRDIHLDPFYPKAMKESKVEHKDLFFS
jgi:hypothetical protein